MPKLIDHLHYRIIDVSTIKELGRLALKKKYLEIRNFCLLYPVFYVF